MDEEFAELMQIVVARFTELCVAPVLSYPVGAQIRFTRGVYVFYENGVARYAGRTNNFRTRLGQHHRDSSPSNLAPFAAWMARNECRLPRTYHIKRSDPGHISRNPDFLVAFAAAKVRIRAMQFRVIEETDPTRQALLEIYAATVLDTEANDFDNH